jgi:hypothetical protein
MDGQICLDFIAEKAKEKNNASSEEKCCYTCENSEILEKPLDYGDYGVYGYCHKNGGNYKIYVPGAKCKDYLATS